MGPVAQRLAAGLALTLTGVFTAAAQMIVVDPGSVPRPPASVAHPGLRAPDTATPEPTAGRPPTNRIPLSEVMLPRPRPRFPDVAATMPTMSGTPTADAPRSMPPLDRTGSIGRQANGAIMPLPPLLAAYAAPPPPPWPDPRSAAPLASLPAQRTTAQLQDAVNRRFEPAGGSQADALPRTAPPAASTLGTASATTAAATTGAGSPSPVAAAAPAAHDISVVNNSGVAITTLSITPAKGRGVAVPIVQNLKALKTAHAPLPPDRGCVFNISGSFADGAPLTIDKVDLCRDPVINVTVW